MAVITGYYASAQCDLFCIYNTVSITFSYSKSTKNGVTVLHVTAAAGEVLTANDDVNIFTGQRL